MTDSIDLTQLTIERRPAESRVRRRVRWFSRYVLPGSLLAGLIALAGWAAWPWLFPPQPVAVIPVMAVAGSVSESGTPLFKAAGWVEPRPTPIRVPALAPGVIAKLLVTEDQAVAAGEPVAELVKEDAELALRDALANEELQEANLEQARAAYQGALTRFEKPLHLRADLADAEASLAQIETLLNNLPHATRRAEAELEFARQNLDGKRAARGAVLGRAVEQAASRLAAAEAQVQELRERKASLQRERDALRKRRDALQARLSLLAEETRDKQQAAAGVRAAEARLERARVAVAAATLRLERMTVRSPIAGRVYQLVGYPGTMLSDGMGPDNADASTVVTLYQPDRLQVRVDVRFEDLPRVELGQPVEITNPAHGEPVAGHVLFIGSEADIQKNTLEVKVAMAAPPPVFKPQMLVDVTFLSAASSPSGSEEEQIRLYVPERLVHSDGAGSFVWTADRSAQVARKTPVIVGGERRDGLVHISSGLDRTSRLIAGGEKDLEHGSRIQITGELVDESVADQPPNTTDSLTRLPNIGS